MVSINSGLMNADRDLAVVQRVERRIAAGSRKAAFAVLLLGTVSAGFSLRAAADAPDAPDADTTLEEVTVSGSRVVRDGYQAPTPVSVVTAEELQSFASTNVADALKTLPSIAGSVAPESMQVNASSGQSGINSLNLRSIGSGRTLTMVDGQRIVASTDTGLVDVNTIPQELIKRVEVVTGGASASWGSDAMGGVVNFILDKEYTGLKASLTGGATNYGDNKSGAFTLTGGTGFAGGRGHLLLSGSFSRQDPVIYNTRDWNLEGWQRVTNPLYCNPTGTTTCAAGTSNSVPNQLILNQVSTYQGIIGGVIGSGPLAGTAFGPGGVPYNVQEGWLVNSGRDMQGGPMWQQLDIRGKHGGAPLASRMRSMSGFMDATWKLTDDVNVGLMLSRNRSQTANWAFSDESYNQDVIKTGNPFIPAEVQQAMDAQGLQSILIGTMHPDIPIAVAAGDRTVTRAALSFDGKLGGSWTWKAYYQYGLSKQFYQTPGMALSDLSKAEDAVVDGTGAINCRVSAPTLLDPTTGTVVANPGYTGAYCVPYNPMGIGVNTAAAIDFATGSGNIQTRMNHLQENVASFTANGTPFSLWAGDVSVAAGAEWRREWDGDSWVDDYSIARLWWAGNGLPTHGQYNVKEAFLETVVPLAKDLPFAKEADLQAAVREEDYSTAGSVTAWKLGGTWKLVDSFTLRGSRSHDIRAPNLSELYAGGRGGAPFVNDPWLTAQNGGQTISYGSSTQSIGNPNLEAEVSDSWGLGFVFQPTFLPGFGTSVDYWDISVTNAIGSAGSVQNVIDNCYAGQEEYCKVITFSNGGPGVGKITGVILSSVNNANQTVRGVDAEASYRFNPGFIPGDVALRLLGTRYLENSTTSTSGVKTDSVGQNSGSTPKFRYTFSATWSNAGWHAALSARGLSAGVYNNYYVECTTGCPVSAPSTNTRAITINNNHIPGAIWFDGSFSKDLMFGESSKASLFLNVRNLLNRDPAVVAGSGAFGDTLSPDNAGLYDVMGRVFNAGVRVEF